jgi:hypothetical protein
MLGVGTTFISRIDGREGKVGSKVSEQGPKWCEKTPRTTRMTVKTADASRTRSLGLTH